MTGSKVVDRKPLGGLESAIERLQLACPSIKTRKRAIEEIAIAGANPELAFAFSEFREEYLDKEFGKNREPYDEAEALRFAAAVRYNLDLDRLWVGPEIQAKETKAKATKAKVTKAKDSKVNETKTNVTKGKGSKK